MPSVSIKYKHPRGSLDNLPSVNQADQFKYFDARSPLILSVYNLVRKYKDFIFYVLSHYNNQKDFFESSTPFKQKLFVIVYTVLLNPQTINNVIFLV